LKVKETGGLTPHDFGRVEQRKMLKIEEQTTVKTAYRIINKEDSRELTKRLSKEAGLIEPIVNLFEKSRIAVYEMFDYLGRMTLKTDCWGPLHWSD
jgi:hypothetical protein